MQETKYQYLEKILSVLSKMPMIKSILQTEKIVGLRILSKHVAWIHGQNTTKGLFEAHREKLSQSQVYQALVDQHTAVELST
jgi:hypothetical protein